MSGKLCVYEGIGKLFVCQGSCVYERRGVCMSGKLCVFEGSCVYVREVVCI